MRRTILALIVLVMANVALTSWAQRVYVFNGVPYAWPSVQGVASEALSDTDGAGTLDWTAIAGASEWPSNLVVFSPTGTCPTGWTEYTDARGRYIVGLVSGGTNLATVGTALSDSENRPVGQHAHAVTDPGHTHQQDAHAHSTSDPGHAHGGSLASTTASINATGNDAVAVAAGNTTTSSATTGSTVDNATAVNNSATTGLSLANAGSVTGTNVPYVQLKACRTP